MRFWAFLALQMEQLSTAHFARDFDARMLSLLLLFSLVGTVSIVNRNFHFGLIRRSQIGWHLPPCVLP